MLRRAVLLNDLAALLESSSKELRIWLKRNNVPVQMREGRAAIDRRHLLPYFDVKALDRLASLSMSPGFYVAGKLSLATQYPEVAREWHPTLNGDLQPSDLRPVSKKSVWWLCKKGHAWTARVGNRTLNERGCPYCSGQALLPEQTLAARQPALAAECHPTKNGKLTPKDVAARSRKPIWWKCPNGPDHEWQKPPDGRVGSPLCPFCTGKRVSRTSSLAVKRPDLVAEWHPTKNGNLGPGDFMVMSNRMVWWQCTKGSDHEWRCSIINRSKGGTGCPFCAGRRACRGNNLADVHPKVARFWHPTKNGSLKPKDVTPSSRRTVWWKCSKGPDHEWENTVWENVRVQPPCPFCADRRVSTTNCLATLYPKVAREWHPQKNGDLTPSAVIATSKSAAWWRCAVGHAWFVSVHARTVLKKGCPVCAEGGRVRGEIERLRVT